MPSRKFPNSGGNLFHQKVVAGKKLPVEIPNRRVGILPHLFEGVFENQAVIALGNVLPLILHRRESAAEPHDRRRLRRVVARIYSGDRLYYGGGLPARKAERVYRVLYRKRRGLLRHNERLLPVVVAGEFFLRQSPYLVAHRGGHALRRCGIFAIADFWSAIHLSRCFAFVGKSSIPLFSIASTRGSTGGSGLNFPAKISPPYLS